MARILLVEDEAGVREMLVDELSVQGHQILEASSGEEGLKKFLSEKPDLVLCDRAMPGMSGYDLLERIRTKHPECSGIPFVFMTALTDPRDKLAVSHLKPTAYIDKPLDFKVLGKKIDELIGKKEAV